jgi:uncharacterized protein YfaP (DUF2135 family)
MLKLKEPLLLLTLVLLCGTVAYPAYHKPKKPSEPRQSGKPIGEGTDPIQIELTDPKGGWTVDRMVRIAGTINDHTATPVTVNINGDRYLLRAETGSFSRKFPVAAGKNSIIVSARNKAGLKEVERTVYSQVPPVPIMAILTSDTDGVYTDLHIYEPKADLASPFVESEKSTNHVFWADTHSPTGGEFYLNEQTGSYDQPGYGPYLYAHAAPPLGIYRIDTNYWPSGDKAHTVAYLNLVLFGGTSAEKRRMVRLPLTMMGETVTLAFVLIDKGQKGLIYVPGMDPKPPKGSPWPQWVADFDPKKAHPGDNYNASYGD